MIKPWYLAPFLMTTALAVSAYWWHSESDTWSPPKALRPDLPKIEPLASAAVNRARYAEERPLFWAARRAVASDDRNGGLTQDLAQSRLTAVLESGTNRVAVLQRKDGSSLKVTMESKPWHITSFDGRKAVFTSADGQQIERLLEAGSPAPAQGAPIAGRVLPKPLASQ